MIMIAILNMTMTEITIKSAIKNDVNSYNGDENNYCIVNLPRHFSRKLETRLLGKCCSVCYLFPLLGASP